MSTKTIVKMSNEPCWFSNSDKFNCEKNECNELRQKLKCQHLRQTSIIQSYITKNKEPEITISIENGMCDSYIIK
jgi:hypothetical protein